MRLKALSFLTALLFCFVLIKTTEANQQVKRKEIKQERALIEEIRTILEPQGISVKDSKLLDGREINSYVSLEIKWEAYPEAKELFVPNEHQKQRPSSKKMGVNKKIKGNGSAVQPHTLEFHTGDIFVAALDNNSELKWWTVVGDPRILRGHTVTPEGHAVGEIYYRPNPDIFLNIPDEPSIVELRFLQLVWTGSQYQIEPVGSISLKK